MADNPMLGRICMVTGATGGIGLATAEALAQRGATVIIVGRNADKGAATVSRIQEQTGNPAVEFMLADLSSQQDIRQLAQQFTSQHSRLHVLVNNAGATYGKRRESVDGIERTFALNHLGYFLLTNLLLDTLKAGAPARIVNVSSEVHRDVTLDFDDLQAGGRFIGYQVYKRSKLANLLFTFELARRLEGTGVTVNAGSPGLAKTNLGLEDGGLPALMKRIINALMGVSPQEGARAIVYLATSPEVEGVSGQYFVKGKATPSSEASCDRAAAARLWQISAELTGLPAG
jgi:NAD(P)-dependent dehydrogenase (short-subunit alcohol dehydrogenase family)